MSTKSIAVLFTVLLVAGVSAYADIVPPIRWDVETGRLEPRPYSLSIRRGESIKIEPRFTSYTAPISLTGATIEMRYSAAYDSESFYTASGTAQSDTGRVQIAWNDSLNPTNNAMVYEIRATLGTNVLARAYGPLTFLGGMVGFNTGLVARTSLDWATVAQTGGSAVLSNQMGTGATWSGTQWEFAGGSGGISALTATNIAQSVYSNNPSGYVTATITNGLGGITTESDPVWSAASNTVVYSNDTRLTDSRAPLAHSQPLASITNAGSAAYASSNAFATAAQGALADTAWQNPASATNWTWTSDGTQIRLTGYTGPVDVVIPDMLDGLPVTGFVSMLFSPLFFLGGAYADNVLSISGGANIRAMPAFAFSDAHSLLTVDLPNVTTVGVNAFVACTSLRHVTMDNVTNLDARAFSQCNIPNLYLPKIASIGEAALDGNNVLTSVVFNGNAPTENTDVYYVSTHATNYITNPTATGWGTVWNGRPVVRMPLYGSGASLTSLDQNPSLTDTVAKAESALQDGQTNVTLGLALGTTVADADQGNEPASLSQVLGLLNSQSTFYFSSNAFTGGNSGTTNRSITSTASATGWTITFTGAVTNNQYLFSFIAPSNLVSSIMAGNQTARIYISCAGSSSTLTCKLEGYLFDPATTSSVDFAETASSFAVTRTGSLPAFTDAISVIPHATNLTGNIRYQIRIKAITANNVQSVTMWGGSNNIASFTLPTPASLDIGQRGATGGSINGTTGTYDNVSRFLALTNVVTPAQIVAAGGVTNVSLNGTLLTVVDGMATGTVASGSGISSSDATNIATTVSSNAIASDWDYCAVSAGNTQVHTASFQKMQYNTFLYGNTNLFNASSNAFVMPFDGYATLTFNITFTSLPASVPPADVSSLVGSIYTNGAQYFRTTRLYGQPLPAASAYSDNTSFYATSNTYINIMAYFGAGGGGSATSSAYSATTPTKATFSVKKK
jgi:hypothetical protein